MGLNDSHTCYNWLKTWDKKNLVLSFKGDFNQEMINAIIGLTEERPPVNHGTLKSKKQIFSIMVECMQNICKHGASITGNPEVRPGILLAGGTGGHFKVSTGNFICNTEVEYLQKFLDQIVLQNENQLYEWQMDIISQTSLSEKSGAGLGLITIARNAEKLDFGIRKYNDSLSFFTLEVIVSMNFAEK